MALIYSGTVIFPLLKLIIENVNMQVVLMTTKPTEADPLLVTSKQVSENPTSLGYLDVSNELLPFNKQLSPEQCDDFPDAWDYSHHKYIEIICEYCGKSHNVPVYCGNRFCPVCSYSRQHRVRERIKFMISNVPYLNTHGIKFLTLTLKNLPDLPKMVDLLLKYFRKLRATKFWKKHVLGGAFVIEVTGSHDDWHAHIHAVIQANYMQRKTLQQIWERISGSWNVDIRMLHKDKAINYLTKYLTKTSVQTNDLMDVAFALKGKRMFSPFGQWYSISNKYVQPAATCRDCGKAAFGIACMVYSGRFLGPERIRLRKGSTDTYD